MEVDRRREADKGKKGDRGEDADGGAEVDEQGMASPGGSPPRCAA
jgi:hypothetical protein